MDAICSRCRSTKLMSGLRIQDQGQHSDGKLKVHILNRDPGALFLKEPLYGRLEATVCGTCGHVELAAVDPAGLYAAYEEFRARPSGGLGPDE